MNCKTCEFQGHIRPAVTILRTRQQGQEEIVERPLCRPCRVSLGYGLALADTFADVAFGSIKSEESHDE